jgi:acyl dehydratase
MRFETSSMRCTDGTERRLREKAIEMTTEKVHKAPRDLDEATIAAVRRRIGIPFRRTSRALNEVSSTDSFRHFARGYGDDNPLYTEPEYARASVWQSPIAPPIYPMSAGVMRSTNWTPDEAAEMSGGDPLAGIGQYMCGERWVFHRPVRAHDVLFRHQSIHSADLRESSFGGGEGALVSHRVTWEDDEGSPFAHRFLDFWHADRRGSRNAGKYLGLERTHYSDDAVAHIDSMYAAETRQGSAQRSIESVSVGDSIGEIVKGPLAVTDIICWHMGIGMGEYGVGALKLGYLNRLRVPGFYQKNDYGIWDVAQRCHWDDKWALQLGQPAPYDYGAMRTNWMVHLVTNWMGDAAWIWQLTASVRKFNYLGDVHFVSGVVRTVDCTAGSVHIDMYGINQRGETTCQGSAVVLLPPDGGTVRLPDFNPDDIPEASAP